MGDSTSGQIQGTGQDGVNARGHQDGKYFFEGAKVGGIPDWATFVGEADRVITL